MNNLKKKKFETETITEYKVMVVFKTANGASITEVYTQDEVDIEGICKKKTEIQGIEIVSAEVNVYLRIRVYNFNSDIIYRSDVLAYQVDVDYNEHRQKKERN